MNHPIVVILHKTRKKGIGTSFRYPACWYGNEKRIQILGYEDTGEIGDDVEERCIAVVPDDLFQEFIRDPEISLIDPAEGNSLLAVWRPPIPIMDDRQAVINALVDGNDEKRIENTRTKTMERSLDPQDSTPGIVMKKAMDINDYLKEK
jgi:hypothetical protein